MLLEIERPPSFELKIKKQKWIERTPWNSSINCVFSRRLPSFSFSERLQNKESISSAIDIQRISNLILIYASSLHQNIPTFGIYIKKYFKILLVTQTENMAKIVEYCSVSLT